MCRMDSSPLGLRWHITFNKDFFCLAPMIYFMGAFLCQYIIIYVYTFKIENQ